MAKKKRVRVGRPPKLTAEVKERLFEGLEMGMGYATAAWRAGITDRTRINWVNKGREVYERLEATEEEEELSVEEYEYLQFFLGHEAAIAESQAWHLANIENNAPNNPQLSLKILEYRFPDDFSPPVQRRELSGRDGKPIQTEDVSTITLAERAAAIKALLDEAREVRDTADDPTDN